MPVSSQRSVLKQNPNQALSNWHSQARQRLAAGAYLHWGTYQPGSAREPNRLTGAEECGVANFSQAYGGAWGWADTPCSGLHASLCKLEGARQAACSLHTCIP